MNEPTQSSLIQPTTRPGFAYCNFTATAPPDGSNDETEGYAMNSVWYDTATGILYKCVDATEDNAEWIVILTPQAPVNYNQLTGLSFAKLLGRYSAGFGGAEELSIGAGLDLSGNTLSAIGFAIGSPVTSGTANSALFVDGSGNLAQDNSNFYYDPVSTTLFGKNVQTNGIGINVAPANSGFFPVLCKLSKTISPSDTSFSTYGIESSLVNQKGSFYQIRGMNLYVENQANTGQVTGLAMEAVNTANSAANLQAASFQITQTAPGAVSSPNGFFVNIFQNNSTASMANSYGGIFQHFNPSGTVSNANGVNVRVGGAGAITNHKGLSFDNFSATNITNNYLIYADTSTLKGTNRWGLYFLPDMPSYHVGRFGIGSGVTAPTARLQVRDTIEQARFEYDPSNYWKAVTNNIGKTDFTAFGSTPEFCFNNKLSIIAPVATQRVIGYDAFNYVSESIASTGERTIDVVGSVAQTVYNDPITAHIKKRASSVTETAKLSPDLSLYDSYRLENQTIDFDIEDPTGMEDGDELLIRIISGGIGSNAITWGSAYVGAVAPLPANTSGGGLKDIMKFVYDSFTGTWDLVLLLQNL